jgi:hypothetical protein
VNDVDLRLELLIDIGGGQMCSINNGSAFT